VVVCGQCFREPTPFHDYDGKAIGEAPILIAAAPVQIDSRTVEFRIERNNFDAPIGVSSAIDSGGGGASSRRRVR
jgi:hypothetical protein